MKIAWSPQGAFPKALTAVMLPQGEVTRKQWLEALSERITSLAEKAPASETAQACRMLGLPETENPQEAGQFLIEGNLNLQTYLSLQMDGEFPVKVEKPSLELLSEIREMTLMDWAELASSTVSESSLD